MNVARKLFSGGCELGARGLWAAALAVLIAGLAAVPAGAATVAVNTTTDQSLGSCAGSCSLRDAVATAGSGDTVQIPAGNYVLTLGAISINKDLTLAGAGARTTVIDGNASSSLFAIFGIFTVEFSDLSLVNGKDTQGGAINALSFTPPALLKLTIRRCTLANNQTSFQGGALNLQLVDLTVEETTFSNNRSANSAGGAIFSNQSGGSIVNSTFSGNTARVGGALDFGRGPVHTQLNLLNNTFTANQGTAVIGGILTSVDQLTLSNNVIAGNGGGDCSLSSASIVTDHNLDGDNSCHLTGPGDLPGVAPVLGPLANNGGPTDTHALLAGSPAIDAGNFATCPAADQRGVTRPQGPVCDIGAFEVFVAPVCAPTFSDFAFGSGTPFGGNTVVAGVGVTLSSTNTEPFGPTAFRDNTGANPAQVQFTFSAPITEFHLDVGFVRANEFLTAFSIGNPTSLSGTLVNQGGFITTSLPFPADNGSGRLSWVGTNTTNMTFTIGGPIGTALAVNQFGLASCALDCIPPPAGMRGWWPGDGDATDFAGTNDGTLIGGAAFTAGLVGQAFLLDGIDDYVSVADAPALDVTTALTLDGWIRADNPIAGHEQRFVSKPRIGGGTGYSLGITPLGRPVLALNNSGFNCAAVAPTPVTAGRWTHLAGTWDVATGDMKIYVDGQLAGTLSGCAVGNLQNSAEPLQIGREFAILGGRYFDGKVDEVEVFDRALSAAEIDALYQARTAGKCKVVAALEHLIAFVESLGLHDGTENSLVSKLENAIASFEGGDPGATFDKVGDFIHEVEAQRGKKIDPDDADLLIAKAEAIRALFGPCCR